MKYYKAVRQIKDKFYSAIIKRKNGGLLYEIGKTTFPKFGLILTFKSLYSAKKFIYENPPDKNSTMSILEGVGIKGKLPVKPLSAFWIDKKSLKELWKDPTFYHYPEYFIEPAWPIGTIGLKEFTPEKIVSETL